MKLVSYQSYKLNIMAEKITKTKKVKTEKVAKEPTSLSATIYNLKGTKAGTIDLPESVFGLKWNADLVHQVTTSMESSARTNVAHTKGRGAVRGGGKKPWKQKGTGRARHGSTRSPIWVGGGVTHGPDNGKNFFRKINKKMKAKALYTILSAKFRDGQILFVDSLSLAEPKAKLGLDAISSLSKIKGFEMLLSKRKNSAYIGLSEKNANVSRGLSNFGNMTVDEIRNVSPLDLLKYKYLVISNPESGLKTIEAKLSKEVVK
jgi:large subunit ribosomal protein L4